MDQLNDFEEREKHYKEKIEQLENDLNKERNIYDIDNKNSEIISNIKNEILSKEKEIQEMTDKNNKQKEQLILISHESCRCKCHCLYGLWREVNNVCYGRKGELSFLKTGYHIFYKLDRTLC